MRPTRSIVLAVVAAVLVTGGCGGGDDGQLRALQDDALLAYAPPGGRLVREADEERSDGGLLGKPSEASAERLYALSGDPGAAFDAAVEVAESVGWARETVSSDDVALFTRQLPNGRATASVTLLRDGAGLPEGTEPPALMIDLVHHGSQGG